MGTPRLGMFFAGKLIFSARIPVKASSKNTVGIDFLTATEYNSRVFLPGIIIAEPS
jgi:hypothetical protein